MLRSTRKAGRTDRGRAGELNVLLIRVSATLTRAEVGCLGRHPRQSVRSAVSTHRLERIIEQCRRETLVEASLDDTLREYARFDVEGKCIFSREK